MDNLHALFDQSVGQFNARVNAIGPSDWDKPTPDTEWTVADLVDHLIDEHKWMPPLLSGHDLATAEKMVAAFTSTGDKAADWSAASTASLQTVGEPGVLEGMVSLSRGPTPASEYLVEMTFDAAIHSWDLGRAIGMDQPLPDELVSFLFPIFMSMADDMAATGMFAPAVAIADDAPLCDRLIAATGRDPR